MTIDTILDSRNLPSRSRSRSRSPSVISQNTPQDNCWFVYIGLFLQGACCLFPWNVVLVGQTYFHSRFRGSDVAQNFLPHFAIIFMSVKFIFLVSGIISSTKLIRPEKQIIISSAGNALCCLILTGLSFWHNKNITFMYEVTLLLILVASLFSSFLEVGFYAVLSVFPPIYTQAYVTGQGVAGLITIGIDMIVYGITGDSTHDTYAFFYFGSAATIVTCAFFGTILLLRIDYFKYFSEMGNVTRRMSHESDSKGVNATYLRIFFKIRDMAVGIFLNAYLTLIVYPTFVLLVQSTSNATGSFHDFIRKKFTNVTLFVIRSTTLIGKVMPMIPVMNTRHYPFTIIGILRSVFIPIVLFSNVKLPGHIWPLPVIFSNDYIFEIIIALLSFTGGYFETLCLMWAPSLVPVIDRSKASAIIVFFLGLGLLLGAFSSLILEDLILHFSHRIILPLQSS